MKHLVIYSLLFVSLFSLGGVFAPQAFSQAPVSVAYAQSGGDGTCGDGIDNNGDGKADFDGAGGKFEADPSCYVGRGATEQSDQKGTGLIACSNYCTFSDILRTINNLIVFLITVLFIPIVVLLFMYAGFSYLMAQGDPKKLVSLKSIIKHIALGMLLVLCAWLIVKVTLTIVVKDSDSALQFLQK